MYYDFAKSRHSHQVRKRCAEWASQFRPKLQMLIQNILKRFSEMNKSAKKLRSITGRHATLNLRPKPMDELHGSRRGGGQSRRKRPATPNMDARNKPSQLIS